MCDREAMTTRGCHLGYTDTLIKIGKYENRIGLQKQLQCSSAISEPKYIV